MWQHHAVIMAPETEWRPVIAILDECLWQPSMWTILDIWWLEESDFDDRSRKAMVLQLHAHVKSLVVFRISSLKIVLQLNIMWETNDFFDWHVIFCLVIGKNYFGNDEVTYFKLENRNKVAVSVHILFIPLCIFYQNMCIWISLKFIHSEWW